MIASTYEAAKSAVERLVGHVRIRDWRIGEADPALTDEQKQDWAVTVHDESGSLLVSCAPAQGRRIDVLFEVDRGVLRIRSYRERVDEPIGYRERVDEPIGEMQIEEDAVHYGTEFEERF